MSFHFPLEKRWDPNAVCAALIDNGLHAHAEDNDVVIDLPGVFKSQFRLLQMLQHLRGQMSCITIKFLPERLIERVDIQSCPATWWIDCEEQIIPALRSQGCLMVGEDISERKIAMRYCCPTLRLLHQLRALEELDAAVWRSDVDLPENWIERRAGIVDKIEEMTVESKDFYNSGMPGYDEPSGASQPPIPSA